MAFTRRTLGRVAVCVSLGLLGMTVAAPHVSAGVGTCTGSDFSITGSSTPQFPIPPGGTAELDAGICSGSDASHLRIDLEVYDSQHIKVAQRVFSDQRLAAGVATLYSWSYPVPTSLPDGAYTVKVGVFSDDWSMLRQWDNHAATFDVGGCTADVVATTDVVPNVVVHAVPFSPGDVNFEEFIMSRVCVGSTADVLLDFEFRGGADVKAEQFVFPNQHFAARETKEYHWFANLPAVGGVYTVKLRFFSPDWSTLLHWDNQAATFIVGEVTDCAGAVTIGPTAATRVGNGVQLTTWVCVGITAVPLWIDLEVYDPNGVAAFQSIAPFKALGFAGGGVVGFHRPAFQLPSASRPGTYTVTVGIFSEDWSTLYKWDNRATTFTVE
jgi:hypothetical protein